MKKRIFSLFLAVAMLIMLVPSVMAEETSVQEIRYEQYFGSYTPTSPNTVASGVLKLACVEENDEKVTKTEQIDITEIADDIVEISFKMLPVKLGGNKAKFYFQLLNGSNPALQLIAEAPSNSSKYDLYIGSTKILSNNTEGETEKLTHLESDSFDSSKFNEIKITMNRTSEKLFVYINGEDITPDGGYDITDFGSGCKFKDYGIKRIRMYYNSSASTPDQFMYIDDLVIKATKSISYTPSELCMDFNASMNYEGEKPKLVISNGTDNKYLGQKIKVSLKNEADDVTEVGEAAAIKVSGAGGNDTASFSFTEEVELSNGWYYVNVDRYIDGAKKGDSVSKKIYVATNAQLEALPDAFSNLENDADAENTVKNNLPCFLSEEEIAELLPEDDEVTAQANLAFITDYFKACDEELETITQVQTEFAKAKVFLKLKNAQSQTEVKSALNEGGYLNAYIENSVFIENENEFFTHFETKRTESALLSDEDINYALRYAIAMTSINAAEETEIEGVVAEFNDVFDLDLTKITSDNKAEIYPVLFNQGYTSLATLQSDWRVTVAAIAEPVQYAQLPPELRYEENFESYILSSNSTQPIELTDGALKISCTTAGKGNEKIALTDNDGKEIVVTDDIVEFNIKMLPVETNGIKAQFIIQLLNGNNELLAMYVNGKSTGKYSFVLKGGNTIQDVMAEHLETDVFDASKFNDIKIVMNRITEKMYLYVNGILVSERTATDAFKTNGIKQIKMQYYDSSTDPNQFMYVDDIRINAVPRASYLASELCMDFNASMNYDETPYKLVLDGTDSKYLAQSMKILMDSDEIGESAVIKAQNSDNALFSFEKDISSSSGWVEIASDRYIGGEKKGDSIIKKIYIASTQEVSALTTDFSNLENDADAQETVEENIKIFLSEDEINELFPKSGDVLTVQGQKNLEFVTSCFVERAKTTTYTKVCDVQKDFAKVKVYLNLKNASAQSEVRTVLEEGGYLSEYLENEVFKKNESAFFNHFEIKRAECAKNLVSDESINNALRYAIAMTSLNASQRSGVQGIVESYNDIFNLDLSKITSDNADEIYPALYNKGYTSLTALQSDWTGATGEIPEEEEDTTLPEEEEKDYSGGGGSGGGGSMKTDKIPTLAPEIEPPKDLVIKEGLKDIEAHWAQKEIKTLYDLKIVNGFEDGSFRPDSTLTRAEIAVMLTRILPEGEEKNVAQFSDVLPTHWYYSAVTKAASAGIVMGADGKFSPDDSITREQLSVMIFRAIGAENTNASLSFADGGEISDYAKEAVAYLCAQSIISGYEDKTFKPKNTATRAEAAKLLCALLDTLSE